jgi:3-methyladenine DNA glycosylase AlkD
MQYDQIIQRLKSLYNPENVAGMARYGINPENTLGISVSELRKMAREIKGDHRLAQQLWASGIHEARMLACIIDDPQLVTEEQMEGWANDFNSWDICDGCCQDLFHRTGLAYQKAVEWSSDDREFVKRAGFVLMSRLALKDKKESDDKFEAFLPILVREAGDGRNYVKKAINWSLRQIGKRSLYLNEKALETARELQQMDSASARWIAADAIRELTSKAVRERLQAKTTKSKRL